MRRKIKKLLAVMLALALIISLVNVDKFSVTAGSPEAQTETQAADSSKEEKTSQTKSEDQKSASEVKSEETDQSSEATGNSGITDSSSSDSKTETDSQSKTDTEMAGGTGEQESEEKSTEKDGEETEAAEGDSQATVTDKNTSSGTNSSKKENTEADSESDKKADVSEEASKKEEEEESQSNNQDESQKDDAQNSESSEDDSKDAQLSYEQAARKALSRMGAAEAFAEGETIANAQDYFVIVDENGDTPKGAPTSFTVTTGDIADASVPEITGYDFVNATINGIEVKSVGTLTYEGENYIYYTTEGSSTGLAAMVLGENEKIRLNYELHRETYDIIYEVTGDNSGINADDIVGTDKPVTVKNGDSYAFRVTIPRGYEAEILVNNESQGKLGIEPTYDSDNSVISVVGEPTELTLSKTYEITDVAENQTVTVNLTRRQSYSFSAELWTQTRYASDNGTPRADFGIKECTFNAENGSADIWTFTTKTSNTWILDGFQINGTKLNIPYGEYSTGFRPVSRTTTLPSGTVVTLTLKTISYDKKSRKYTRTYTLSVSNCYENITITGGNLNASGWTEVIPDRLTGVEFQVYDQQTGNTQRTWKNLEQSEPFGVGSWNDTNKNYWFDTQGLRFRLLPGYVNPKVTYGTTTGIGNNDLNNLITYTNTPDSGGWYYITIKGQNNNSITMLRIEAELGYYDVSYDDGNHSGSGQVNLPSYDDGNYNIVNNSQIIVSNTIPTDSSNAYVFDYWTLEGYVDDDDNPIQIFPNQVLNLEDVAEYANIVNGQYVLPLKAHWVDASTAEQITYTIQFVVEDENGTVIGKVDKGNYQAPRGSTIILDTESEEVRQFLEEHPEYVLNETKTVRYNSNIQAGNVLTVYFTKAVTDVTIEKNVAGNMGDRKEAFDFELYINDEKQNEFSLSDGQTKIFENLAIGTTIKFKEESVDGYTVTASHTDKDDSTVDGALTLGNDGYYSITVTKDLYITVTNTKNVNPPSGLAGGSDSWMILLGAAAVLAVTSGGFYLRRKKAGTHD